MSATTGIQIRHGRGCPAADDKDARCRCKPSYRAEVYDRRAGQKIRKTFPTISAAKAWRSDSLGEVRRGQLRAAPPTTLRGAATAWLAGAEDGSIRTRSGDRYKPSALRGYRAALESRILDELGAHKLADIRRRDVQDLADRLIAEGLDPSTVRNALMPLRAIYRRAVSRGDATINPTTGLELPAVRGRRDRIVSPVEAAALIAAVPEADRPVWATACYAGLRLGELQALRDEDVDLAEGVIRVERSWDPREGVIEPKSHAGKRTVPIVAALRVHLAAHKLRRGKAGGLFFGEGERPFNRDGLVARAGKAWKAAGLAPLGLHEARHGCASLFIAAGVNVKALSSYLGHASITITLDRYGHLLPGSEAEAVGLVDAYIERAAAASAGQPRASEGQPLGVSRRLDA
jgi:integrase